MKRIVALAMTATLAFVGIALPAENVPAAVGAQAYTFIGYGFGDDFTSNYLANRFYITGSGERTLLVGKTAKLKLSRSVAGVKWKSSKPKVASVSTSGKALAKKPGLATITAYNPTTGFSATCTVGVYRKVTQAQARKKILALKASYPEGLSWNDDNRHYDWRAARTSCYGCAAFAGIVSDKAFGKYAPFKKHANFSKVKVGDSIRIGNWHSVIVLGKSADAITICEGNYNGRVHWGDTLSRSYLEGEGFQVWTRYR
ncbi:MAG: Ig-like domain-containing protein [Eggerthellaceae bacterium]|nr:Ig-like domain-containing protein [Eggerthellaceae bacterium]